MAVRKSVPNIIDISMDSPTFSSSPIRRKSVLLQKSVYDSTLVENDDEAERSDRRKKFNDAASSLTSTISNDKRRSLGLSFLVHMPASQMAERISQCIKLGTENKINPKNAFSLEMIDFMTYMIKKQDTNMSNLQVASTSLDVSTKIYGFRVDGMHMEILKMIGGLEKQERDDKKQSNASEMDYEENTVNSKGENLEKRKRSKKRHQIFATVEALKTNIETEKPSLLRMEADLQTADMLYQVLLPNHANSRFYPHPYTDVLVDKVGSKEVQNKDTVCNIPEITDFSQMDICPPLRYFEFRSWNADDEPEEIEEENKDESRFRFDLNASVPFDDEDSAVNSNHFNNEECTVQNVDKCARISNPVENIVDFRNVLTNTKSSKTSEYSYIQNNLNIHWAGPSHWKVTNFKKVFSNNKVIETCRQAPSRKKKEIELHYNDETLYNVSGKFLPGLPTKNLTRSIKVEWNEEVLTLPPDEHYDIAQANKLHLHTITLKYPESKKEINTTCLSNDGENDYVENRNDLSTFIPNVNNDDYHDNGNSAPEDEGVFGTQLPFTGENLVAIPKLTNKSSIAYSMRAKKIDMKQLKTSIWTCLTNEESEKERSDDKMNSSKQFSKVYKILPNLLTKTNIEALSFPISFVSLLHLANEKTLKVTSCPEFADLIVEQD